MGYAVGDRASSGSPRVSVVAISYNHAAYIRETLDGFVSQKTGFPVEIIVADDASTDATPTIIQAYSDRFSHLFRPILRAENLGIHANLTDALSAARGEYIALCEGDDYWIDPLKLSKQVMFLDQHPTTAVCFHPVQVIWEDGREGSEFPPLSWRTDFSVESLIRRKFIQTNSVMYRRLPRYDDIPADVMPMDWYLHVKHAVHGDIAMLPDTMSVYRRHSNGVSYDAVVNPEKFWLAEGSAHAAMSEAMLDLVAGDPLREEAIGEQADWVFRQIAKVPGPEGRALLLDTIARRPRIAMLALRRWWATTEPTLP